MKTLANFLRENPDIAFGLKGIKEVLDDPNIAPDIKASGQAILDATIAWCVHEVIVANILSGAAFKSINPNYDDKLTSTPPTPKYKFVRGAKVKVYN